MNLYDATIPIFTKMLDNIGLWFDKAVAHAARQNTDPEALLGARLAADQFALTRQVQHVCDHAKNCAARLTGREAPSHPDTETSIAELRARLSTCKAYLETFTRADFVGAEERMVSFRGKAMRGGDYLDHYALPNFHFHATTAYAILRHNGVELGKADYLGTLPFAP